MIPLVAAHQPDLVDLGRRHGVCCLDLFGSAATGAVDAATSDPDFVVTFADTRSPGYADRYLAVAEALEALFCRPVDLLTECAFRTPPVRQAVEATRQPVYDGRNALAAA